MARLRPDQASYAPIDSPQRPFFWEQNRNLTGALGLNGKVYIVVTSENTVQPKRTWPLVTLVLIAIVGAAATIFALLYESNKRIDAIRAEDSHTIYWNMAQLEVDFLAFHNAADRLFRSYTDEAATNQLQAINGESIRASYLQLETRLHTLRASDAYDAIAVFPSVADAMPRVEAGVKGLAFIKTASFQTIFDSAEDIHQMYEVLLPDLHAISHASVEYFAQQSSKQKIELAQGLRVIALLATVFMGLLCAVAMVLVRKNRTIRAGVRQIEGTTTRLESTITASLDSILVVSEHGVVLDFNEAAENTFGYTKSEALGQNMMDLFFPENLVEPSMRSIKRYLETGDERLIGGGRVQLVVRHRSGRTFPVELSIGSTQNPDGRLFIAYIRDISAQLAAETELMRARDKALEGEKAKSRFLAVMSHEMRTPLNGLLGTLDLLSRTQLTTKQIQYLTIATKSGNLLLDHVNDVLDISKIEAGHMEQEQRPFNPLELLKEVCDGQRSVARARNNALSIGSTAETLGTVVGDPSAVRQILLNLVSNANKFTTDGSILIEAEDLADEGGTIEFRVADTGIGVAEAHLEDIFSDFVTLDPRFDREAEGTGLGLAIAKRLVELMGGEIGVESEEGEGSLFWFRIPFARHMDEIVGGEHHPSAMLASDVKPEKLETPLRILLVEDNQINRFVAREMLEADGHVVTEAHDGEEGAQAAIVGEFDVILMDISMPRLDGVSATEIIRKADTPKASVPIVALTAHALAEDFKRFQEAGMDYCLSKPVVRDELRGILAKASALRTHEVHTEKKDMPARDELAPLINQDILAQLIEILGQTRVDELFKQFINEADITISELTLIDTAQKVKAALPEVHRLAGSASTFGAQRLQHALGQLEAKGKAGQAEDFIEDLPTLPTILMASKSALTHAINP